MKTIRAFVLGLYEFRRMFTTSFDTDREYEAYDWGREIAHRVTLRRWDYE
jgi:hypothetical protein